MSSRTTLADLETKLFTERMEFNRASEIRRLERAIEREKLAIKQQRGYRG